MSEQKYDNLFPIPEGPNCCACEAKDTQIGELVIKLIEAQEVIRKSNAALEVKRAEVEDAWGFVESVADRCEAAETECDQNRRELTRLRSAIFDLIEQINDDRRKDHQWYRSMELRNRLNDILNPPRNVDKRSSSTE